MNDNNDRKETGDLKKEEDRKYLIESKRQFNEFQSQSRARMESTVKFVLAISAGMLTLTIGLVLGRQGITIPCELITYLKWGWCLLFYSIASSLLLMLGVLVASYHMGTKWFARIEKQILSTEAIKTWDGLRYFIIALGISVVLSCIGGVGLMAYIATRMASGL